MHERTIYNEEFAFGSYKSSKLTNIEFKCKNTDVKISSLL